MRIRRYKGGKLSVWRLRWRPNTIRIIELDLSGEIGPTATVSSSTWEACPDDSAQSGLTIGTPTDSGQATTATVTAPEIEATYVLRITCASSTGEKYVTEVQVIVREEADCE